MHTALFRHSDVQDPYGFYAARLIESPLFHDRDSGAWFLYSYAHCHQLLHNRKAQIPAESGGDLELMNEYCLRLIRNLVRLRNPSDHLLVRLVTLKLFETRDTVSISGIMERLLAAAQPLPAADLSRAGEQPSVPGDRPRMAGNNASGGVPDNGASSFDWMAVVANQLPVRVVAESFGFSPTDTGRILATIGNLVRIMSPGRTPEQIAGLNEAVEEIYLLTERHLLARELPLLVMKKITGDLPFGAESLEESVFAAAGPQAAAIGLNRISDICVSNLVGLLIQSYDAGRGILGNALLQLLQQGDLSGLEAGNRNYIAAAVQETLRFDPPVHHTRRVLTEDIILDNSRLKKGQTLILMLAAANRDARQFARPDIFDPYRDNNHELLTFGSGSHECIARHFATHMATEALLYLFQAYPGIRLLNRPGYEPLINVRIPKEMLVYLPDSTPLIVTGPDKPASSNLPSNR